MRELIDKLNYYTKLYDEGNPAISDKEWDDLYFKLVMMERETGEYYPDSPTQKVNYEVVSKLNKVYHNHPMLSLDKTKDWAEFVKYFGSHEAVLMPKLDGLTCSLTYEEGKLAAAETRGNGVIGEDILHNALTIKSIPKRIPYSESLTVDGEIICTTEDFKAFADEYKNPRNFAAGSIRLLDSKECAKRNLTFVVWNTVTRLSNSFIDCLDVLNDMGFVTIPYTGALDLDAPEWMEEKAKDLGYPIDGLVGRFDDIAYGESLGATEHHSRAAYAFKFYDEEYETELVDIEWSMGRTGTLTPVAIFKPVEIEGTMVERANLFNLSNLKTMCGGRGRPGDKLKIYKANLIIPQVSSWEYCANNLPMQIPSICPICGGATRVEVSEAGVENLVCDNPDCAGKLVNKFDHFVGKKGLDIKGLSKATLQKLIDQGWLNELADIFTLHEHAAAWSKIAGFGEKSVNNILNAIEQGRRTSLESFISGIGIPLVGRAVAKEIVKYTPTWEEFREGYDWISIPGFGVSKQESLYTFDYSEADRASQYITFIEDAMEQPAAATLSNMTIVITGKLHNYKNRDLLASEIESHGGKVASSVSNKTSILINNDTTSTSSKNLKAQSLGVLIMSEEEFINKYLKGDN